MWGARTYVAGIVNCAPDSFSGDGYTNPDEAVAHGLRLVDEGADLLDVGGESTRPGATPIAEGEELRRVLPVVTALAERAGVPVAVDTSKAAVATAALAARAVAVNDVWALARDPDLAAVVAEWQATVVLMHNGWPVPALGATIGTRPAAGSDVPVEPASGDVVERVGVGLEERVAAAERAGIARDRMILDPGIGFGKRVAESLALLRRLGEIKRRPALAGLPLLVGTSRKGFIGRTLGVPVHERLEGTLATLALAIARGADLVRVHDVRAAVRCCRMADAIVRGQKG